MAEFRERETGRDIVWEAIAVTWVKVILARNGTVSVGEMRIPEVEWADWHLIDQRVQGEEGEGGVEVARGDFIAEIEKTGERQAGLVRWCGSQFQAHSRIFMQHSFGNQNLAEAQESGHGKRQSM